MSNVTLNFQKGVIFINSDHNSFDFALVVQFRQENLYEY